MSQSEAESYEVSREALLTREERLLAEHILVGSLQFDCVALKEADELAYSFQGFPRDTVESLPKWLED